MAITSRLSPRPTLSLQARPAEAQTSDQRGPCPSLWTRSTVSILSWACHFPAPKSPEARRWVLWTLLPARPPCLSYVSPACAPPGPRPLLAHHALPLSRSPSNVTPLPHLSVSIAGRGASGMWLSILFLARSPWKWRRVGPAAAQAITHRRHQSVPNNVYILIHLSTPGSVGVSLVRVCSFFLTCSTYRAQEGRRFQGPGHRGVLGMARLLEMPLP